MNLTPRLRLAEVIARAHGERLNFEGEGLDRFVGHDKHFWLQPHVLDPILAAARECVAGEVGANYPGLDGERPEPFTHAGVAA